MMADSGKTVIFWGAGATATLGMSTTEEQQCFLNSLAPDHSSSKRNNLDARIREALGHEVPEKWVRAFTDLLRILGDSSVGQVAGTRVETITDEQVDAMARNWNDQKKSQLRRRIFELRRLYDWPALIEAINICPGRKDGSFKINDLFNLLDLHQQSGHGFRYKQEKVRFIPEFRIIGARGALKLMIQSLMFVKWHTKNQSGFQSSDLRHHFQFAIELGRRMQNQGLKMESSAKHDNFERTSFILGDLSFVSMNWDPIGLWCQFIANRSLNRASNVPHVGTPPRKLQIFTTLAPLLPAPKSERINRAAGFCNR